MILKREVMEPELGLWRKGRQRNDWLEVEEAEDG